MKGKVTRFNQVKGFGFITYTDENTNEPVDAFFHFSQLLKDDGKDIEGYKTTHVGDEVEFDVEETDKGLQAKNINITKKNNEKKG